MKSLVLLSLFALIGTFVYAQNIPELDSTNSFKDFKLGTSKTLYTDYIKNSNYSEKSGSYSIEINKFPSLGSAFGSDVATISLKFDGSDKLQKITISYRLLPKNNNTDTNEVFKEAKILLMKFGAASETSLDNPSFRYYRWITKKVTLELDIHLVMGSDAEYWYKEVVFQN